MAKTSIEWCDTVWNIVTGCTKVSAGCTHCYAERMSKRLAGRCGYPADDPFRVTLHPEKFIEPLRWRKPRRVFVDSMGDLFHPNVQDDWILAAFVAMGLTYEHTGKVKEVSLGHKVGIYRPKHTFMILTKRPQRMKDFMGRLLSKEPDEEWDKKAQSYAARLAAMNGAILPGNAIFEFGQWLRDGLPGLWLGVSVENQAAADERIPLLMQTPAAVRLISAEPLLGELDLSPWLGISRFEIGAQWSRDTGSDLDWVIAGSESGPNARPMDEEWVKSLREQCISARTAFFYKQIVVGGKKVVMPKLEGKTWAQFPSMLRL